MNHRVLAVLLALLGCASPSDEPAADPDISSSSPTPPRPEPRYVVVEDDSGQVSSGPATVTSTGIVLHETSGHREVPFSRARGALIVDGPAMVVSSLPVTLPLLLAVAAERAPGLAAVRADPAVARAVLAELGVLPNPVFAFDYRRQFDTQQDRYALNLGYPVDLSGQSAVREREAALGVQAADVRVRAAVWEAATRVRAAFARAVSLQQLVQVRTEGVEVARRVAAAARVRAAAGDASAAAADEAELALAITRDGVLESTAELTQARSALAASVGIELPPDVRLVGSVGVPRDPVNREQLVERARRARPDLTLARLAIEQADLGIELERARRVPVFDLGVRADIRSPGDDLAGAFIAFPLPLFDRRQAAIVTAQARADQARAAAEDVEHRTRVELLELCVALEGCATQLTHLEAEVLPRAARRATTALAAFEAGDLQLELALAAVSRELDLRAAHERLQHRYTMLHLAIEAATGPPDRPEGM